MKQLVKRFLLKTCATLCKDVGGKILYYHDVFSTTRYTTMGTPVDLFRLHIAAAKESGFIFIKDVPVNDWELQICFDDGFRGIWDCKELLMSEHISPTVYIAPGLVGGNGYLCWHEIIELQKMGFRFENHTWSHRPLTLVPQSDFKHEIVDSKKCIEDKIGHSVTQLCFPCGFFSRSVLDFCNGVGYKYLLTSVPGSTATAEKHGFRNMVGQYTRLLPRTLVQAYNMNEFRAVLKGALLPFAGRYFRRHFHKDT